MYMPKPQMNANATQRLDEPIKRMHIEMGLAFGQVRVNIGLISCINNRLNGAVAMGSKQANGSTTSKVATLRTHPFLLSGEHIRINANITAHG